MPDYNDTKEYSKIIMPEIMDILSENDIIFSTNTDNTEIVISLEDGMSEENVEKLITDNTSVPKTIFVILVQLTVVDDKLYIRQSTI